VLCEWISCFWSCVVVGSDLIVYQVVALDGCCEVFLVAVVGCLVGWVIPVL